jgi:hypothetical protein
MPRAIKNVSNVSGSFAQKNEILDRITSSKGGIESDVEKSASNFDISGFFWLVDFAEDMAVRI